MGESDYLATCRQFIEKFASNIDTFSVEECETPFRLVTYHLVPSEVEGECLEWIRRYLSLHDCPAGLVSQLARAVFRNFEDALSLSQFYLEPGNKHDKSDDDDDDADDDGDPVDGDSSESSSEGHVHNSGPPQLDASQLLQKVVACIHSTVKAWSTSPPALVTPATTLQAFSHAIKNTRRKMEDRHVLIPDLNVLFDIKEGPSQSYFAVFDGHGGLEAAEYAATHLHGHLVSDPNFLTDPEAAMRQAYKTTDIKFLEKARREGLRSGTTGVSVLIRESELYVGWLGDSQAMLVSSGQPVQIMIPHKPDREDERRRIEELGGCVLYLGVWRVNGNISVSRAIGDAPYKPYVSSDADVTRITLTGEEEYLVLGCDGLWDVLTPSQVANIVYKHSKMSPWMMQDVAVQLVNAARDSGSSDNISVVVIFFKSTFCAPKAASTGNVVFGFNKVSENNVEKLDTSPSFSQPASLNPKVKPRANGRPQEMQKEKAALQLDSNSNSFHSTSAKPTISSCSSKQCSTDFVRRKKQTNGHLSSVNKHDECQSSVRIQCDNHGSVASTYCSPLSADMSLS